MLFMPCRISSREGTSARTTADEVVEGGEDTGAFRAAPQAVTVKVKKIA
jgi:hypothetical protein